MKIIKKGLGKFFLLIINFYQKRISPYTMPSCKYFPTCSQYAVDAIKTYGPFKGGLMAIWRLLRCNPFSKGGFDPVKKLHNNEDENNEINRKTEQ